MAATANFEKKRSQLCAVSEAIANFKSRRSKLSWTSKKDVAKPAPLVAKLSRISSEAVSFAVSRAAIANFN